MKKIVFLLILSVMMMSGLTASASGSSDEGNDRRGGYCWSQGDQQGEYECRDGYCRRR